jgi:cysteine-rich repeat protein
VWLAGAAAADAQCVGDCNGDGTVAINELVLGVNIALGSQPASACAAFQDQNGMVNISQLIKGVNNALGSCPTASTPTPTTPIETPTATSTPISTETPSGPPVCGDGKIETGETCDDGNTMDGDNCPATCVIQACQFSTTMLDVDVFVHTPDGVTPGVLQVFLRYPDGVVALPSSGAAAAVAISNLPDVFATIVNDLDYAVRVIVEDPGGFVLDGPPAGRLFTAQFTLCQGATTPAAADFHCSVENATAVEGTDVTDTTTCSVALP